MFCFNARYAMLFEWRMQINWLLEFLCAAFIATGKPWMDCGKWNTTGKQKGMRMHRPFVKRFICTSHVGTYYYWIVRILVFRFCCKWKLCFAFLWNTKWNIVTLFNSLLAYVWCGPFQLIEKISFKQQLLEVSSNQKFRSRFLFLCFSSLKVFSTILSLYSIRFVTVHN